MEVAFDVHCGIIKLLDYHAIMNYKQASKLAYKLVHTVYKRLTYTNNIFDAARNNDELNFRRLALLTPSNIVIKASQVTTSPEIVKYAAYIASTTNDPIDYHAYIQYATIVSGVSPIDSDCTVDTMAMLIHNNKLESYPRLTKYNDIYAAMGLYEYITLSKTNDIIFACAAYISKDDRIIALADKESYDNVVNASINSCDQINHLLCKYAIIVGDEQAFERMFSVETIYKGRLLRDVILYNRISFVQYFANVDTLCLDTSSSIMMTYDMAFAIVWYLPKYSGILIRRAYNYSLTQLFPRLSITRDTYYDKY